MSAIVPGFLSIAAATGLAFGGVAIHAPRVAAECSGYTHTQRLDPYLGHAFRATVTDVAHQPFSAAYGDAFNWAVTLDVTRADRGAVPRRLVVKGWDAGCSALNGDRLRVGDQLFISVGQLDMERFPSLEDDLLIWRATDDGWRFARTLLDHGDDPRFYPPEARAATTTAAILALVDPDAAPGRLIDAVDPSPAPSKSPSPSAAAPFPWPTLPPRPDPADASFQPSGPPDATATRHGVTVALWLSSRSVAPGEPVEAVVRITNDRADAAWSSDHPCGGGASVGADLTAVLDPGAPATGMAAEVKRRIAADVSGVDFEPVSTRRLPGANGLRVTALADCGLVAPSFTRLGPGRTLERRWTWYPTDPFDGAERWFRPLPPGIVPITVTWPYAGHGPRPDDRAERRPRTVPIMATVDLELTGTDPGLLAPLELVDRALADPGFAAWVETGPPGATDLADAWVEAWPGPAYDTRPPVPELAALAPNGALEVAVAWDMPGLAGVSHRAWVDPWTGALLLVTTD